jgi:PIN domain nuclease of toxin-antitoxin system
MPIFLDTHAWLWWVTRDSRLSSNAELAIRNAVSNEGVWISTISVWEIAKKVQKQQLDLDRPLREWLDAACTVPGLYLAELTRHLLIESCQLPRPFHGDPADQIIVATVRHHGGRLITKDRDIRRYRYVQSLW